MFKKEKLNGSSDKQGWAGYFAKEKLYPKAEGVANELAGEFPVVMDALEWLRKNDDATFWLGKDKRDADGLLVLAGCPDVLPFLKDISQECWEQVEQSRLNRERDEARKLENARRSLRFDIYLAGRITGQHWRNEIVNIDGAYFIGSDYEPRPWPVLRWSINKCHNYVGPFASDHGHSDNNHGCSKCHTAWHDRYEYRDDVRRLCYEAIRRCSLFFAWIEDTECYGTLVEIGYAIGLGKRVFMASPEGTYHDDLWFAFGGPRVTVLDGTAAESFAEALDIAEQEALGLKKEERE